MFSLPPRISFFITYKCNLRCPYCYLPEKFFEQKDEKSLEEIISEFKKTKIKSIDILGGEPFLEKKKLIKLLQISLKEGIDINSISTNGTIWDEEVIYYIKKIKGVTVQVSVDSATPATYRIMRASSQFEKVIGNVKRFVKSKIRTIISFVAARENWKEIKKFIELAKKLNVKGISLGGFIPIGRGIKCKEWMLNLREISEIYTLAKSERKIKIFGIEEKDCPAIRESVAILPNGDIYPCGLFISFPETKIGNIFERKMPPNKFLKKLINLEIPAKCKKCPFPSLCFKPCKAFIYSRFKYNFSKSKINCIG